MRAGQVAFVLQLYGLGAIFSLGWAALDSPEGLPAARYPNIIFDLHLYYGVLVPPRPRPLPFLLWEESETSVN